MLIFVLVSNNPLRLAMLTAGFQCLKYCSFKNEIKCCYCWSRCLPFTQNTRIEVLHKHIYIYIYAYAQDLDPSALRIYIYIYIHIYNYKIWRGGSTSCLKVYSNQLNRFTKSRKIASAQIKTRIFEASQKEGRVTFQAEFPEFPVFQCKR